MNVAFLTDSFPPIVDGVSRCVVECAKSFTEIGQGNCIVVTPYKAKANDSSYNFPVFRFPSVKLPKMEYRLGYPYLPTIIKKLKEYKTDIIHAHSPFMAMSLARQIRQILNIPIIYTQHTKWEFDIGRAVGIPAVAKVLEKFVYKNINSADEVWAVTRYAGKHMTSRGFKGDFIVMPNGTDFPRADADENLTKEINQKHGLSENIPVLLFVGRMMWYKNQGLILDALEILKAKDFDFRMIFIGDGRDLEDMKKTVREKNLHDRVFFTGLISDRELLRAYYTRANMFVFPSTYETSGIVVGEAAACRCPSLVARGSAPSEILEEYGENQSGFFADENAGSVAATILEAFENMEKYEFVRKNAADKVYLPWSKVMENSIARYEEVCENYKNK